LANRGYTDGFYERHHTHEYQNYIYGASQSHQQQFVAEMTSYDAANGWMDVEVKNHFAVGDRLELIVPNGQNQEFTLEAMRNKHGEPIEVALGSGHFVKIPVPNLHTDKVLISRFI